MPEPSTSRCDCAPDRCRWAGPHVTDDPPEGCRSAWAESIVGEAEAVKDATGRAVAVMPSTNLREADWTADQQTGRSNSSEPYLEVVAAVASLLDSSAYQLMNGHSGRLSVARLIVSNLAHKHGMVIEANKETR